MGFSFSKDCRLLLRYACRLALSGVREIIKQPAQLVSAIARAGFQNSVRFLLKHSGWAMCVDMVAAPCVCKAESAKL